MKKYFAWFYALNEREQMLVSVAAVFAAIALFYFALWSPLNNALTKQQQLLNNQRSFQVWVEDQAARAAKLRQSATGPSFNGSLTQLVNQSTRSSQIQVARMQPVGENLQITIDEVSFNALITWLDSIERRGVVVVQSDITETNEAGYVQVRRLQLGKR
ncbi:type II secretion system protein M [Glaciecola sp. MH2013]|uniref:type II secretion system protein GspM n=1 Tax=Glaciecola sp. MH2013 TaxID=2785524 RepID=UPI00189E95CD|nr:type II secretion system protein M [Glaciecola sp. MH2013]MBF7074361.1 type II secretion system protein M [Glaciecola sp. MH2013]